MLAGDSHNGWAFDLDHDGRPAGVEIGGHSVTSPGFEAYTPDISDDVRVAALRASSPQLQWANTQDRGYVSVAITPDKVAAHWHSMETIREKSLALKGTHSMTVRRGKRVYEAV
ncbi:alkaline phosphatase D family protein [Sphingopyxis sp. PET50]|uniref:alkaline phosphatase D family protein n=1 Tax=Sphingopyxis sp. PET50 TaxID=2976533 RepID=UPI0028A80C11|nr:alkaline phosphatase D family protein [Sphingopyxis sp. PET50]